MHDLHWTWAILPSATATMTCQVSPHLLHTASMSFATALSSNSCIILFSLTKNEVHKCFDRLDGQKKRRAISRKTFMFQVFLKGKLRLCVDVWFTGFIGGSRRGAVRFASLKKSLLKESCKISLYLQALNSHLGLEFLRQTPKWRITVGSVQQAWI